MPTDLRAHIVNSRTATSDGQNAQLRVQAQGYTDDGWTWTNRTEDKQCCSHGRELSGSPSDHLGESGTQQAACSCWHCAACVTPPCVTRANPTLRHRKEERERTRSGSRRSLLRGGGALSRSRSRPSETGNLSGGGACTGAGIGTRSRSGARSGGGAAAPAACGAGTAGSPFFKRRMRVFGSRGSRDSPPLPPPSRRGFLCAQAKI